MPVPAYDASRSSNRTSFYGRQELKYIPIPVEKFHYLDSMDNAFSKIGDTIVEFSSGKYSNPVIAAMLEEVRIKDQ